MADGAWGVVIPAGPGEAEVGRVADLLDAVATFEPETALVVVVHDEAGVDRTEEYLAAAGALRDRTEVIPNPRDPGADGWTEGVLEGVVAGYRAVLEHERPVDWVLRLDTDAMVIGPFAERIARSFASDRDLGVLGTYRFRENGEPLDYSRTWGRPIRKYAAPVAVWRRRPPFLRSSLRGDAARRRRMVAEAMDLGYEPGEHCQGGAYAIRVDVLATFHRRGWRVVSLWRGTNVTEDVVISLAARANGFELGRLNRPGEVFAVRHQGLPGDPDELVADGYGVVHSIKSFGRWSEDELRCRFRALRHPSPG